MKETRSCSSSKSKDHQQIQNTLDRFCQFGRRSAFKKILDDRYGPHNGASNVFCEVETCDLFDMMDKCVCELKQRIEK